MSSTEHLIQQKLSSIALLVLSLWFVPSLVCLAQQDLIKDAALTWIKAPHTPVLLIAYVLAACVHFAGHLEEIIMDYVHCRCGKAFSLIALKLGFSFLAIVLVYQILALSFAA